MVAAIDKSGISKADISRLVREFYRRVRTDPRLRPIFERRIGTCDCAWEPHLSRIEAFWANVMLGGREYQGNPMQVHAGVPEIRQTDFNRWLDLFEKTAREVLSGSKADAFVILSRRIEQSLWIGLQRTRAPDGPPVLGV